MTTDPIGFLDIKIPINDTATLRRALTAMDGTGPSPVPAPVPPQPPQTDVNTYPLTMPPVVAPGDGVNIGIGPNVVHLRMNAGITEGDVRELAVFLDGRVIALLTVTGIGGQDGGQVFTIRGVFGAPPHRVKLVGTGIGMAGLWINSVTVDYEQLVYNLSLIHI